MERSINLANRLKEVLLNGRWVAQTNFKVQLESVTWRQATHKFWTLNTIAALTYHVNYYIAGVLNVLKGGQLEIKDKSSYDLPPIESEADWKSLVDDFLVNAEKFVNEVAQLQEAQLDKPFVDEKYGTYLRNIEAINEHCYYHLGQISLIRKMIAESS